MRILAGAIATAVPILFLALPVQAAGQTAGAQSISSGQILAGEYAGAETRLRAQLRNDPDNSVALLNLAAVYLNTGREDAAGMLYRRVLVNDDVPMQTADGALQSAHAIARRGLSFAGSRGDGYSSR